MANTELKEFSKTFHAEIRAEAHSQETLREEVFVEKMGGILEDYGEIETVTFCQYQSRGAKVDGYCYDDEFKDIVLVVSHFIDKADTSESSVTNTEITTAFKRAIGFFQSALKQGHRKIDVANEAHDLARTIYECRKEIRNVKIVLVTDGVAKRRPAEVQEMDGVDVSCVAWDLDRTFHFHSTGERENIKVDFVEQCGGPLPCVVHKKKGTPYTTYVGFIPGDTLADFYAQWGINMLDMNVRVFLSARGNVNKQIRKTIVDEPEMFCAYNNGITVFAKGVETVPSGEGVGLVSADDFQIINGGQTTASLYHTRKKDRADLSSIYVQIKVTVVHDESKIPELIPLISKYANNQNKVQLADFAANEKPHPEIQVISNNIPAPDPTGGSALTYWFYDRARGSYEETRNLTAKTPAQKKAFDKLRPKRQKFDKIKFAKIWNSWLRQPHIVSLGGQKNFARFNLWLMSQKEDWGKFFRKTVALVILWNESERIVRRKKYEGYRGNIVTYTISWLIELINNQFHQQLDLEKIWKNQALGEELESEISDLSELVNEHIRDTNLNVTEYCKKEDCWDKLKSKKHRLSAGLKSELGAGKAPEPPPPHEAIRFCTGKGSKTWWELASWLKQNDYLTGKERSQCANMAKALGRNKKPSEVLSKACMKIWDDSVVRGFTPPPPPTLQEIMEETILGTTFSENLKTKKGTTIVKMGAEVSETHLSKIEKNWKNLKTDRGGIWKQTIGDIKDRIKNR